jgi:hypothetical protein
LVCFTKNAPHLKKNPILVRQKSRLKVEFFTKEATKKPTKFRQKQTKKVDFFSKKTDYFYHP